MSGESLSSIFLNGRPDIKGRSLERCHQIDINGIGGGKGGWGMHIQYAHVSDKCAHAVGPLAHARAHTHTSTHML